MRDDPPATPTATGPPVDTFGRPLADWWKRLVAMILDGLVLTVPSLVFLVLLGFDGLDDVDDGGAVATGAGFAAATVLASILAVAYYALLDGGEQGQTFGKRALRIQVRDQQTGGPIGYGRGVLRRLPQSLAGFVTCLGGVFVVVDGLFPLWDPGRQTIHDKLARTVVIDVGR